MEEFVGKLWHRLITARAQNSFPKAEVRLDEIKPTLAILARALGKDPQVEIVANVDRAHRARRRLIEKVAGTGQRAALGWRNGQCVCLPQGIAVFPQKELNRTLYLWLTVLLTFPRPQSQTVYESSRQQVNNLLEALPAWQLRYKRLVTAYLPLRPNPDHLPYNEGRLERQIQRALIDPELNIDFSAEGKHPPAPVLLWSSMPGVNEKPSPMPYQEPEVVPSDGSSAGSSEEGKNRQRGKREVLPEGKGGLMSFRLESLFAWIEYLPLNRPVEDDLNDNAAKAVDDLEEISVARDQKPSRHKIKLDLDLPAPEYDDIPLGEGVPLPEWDYRLQRVIPDYCNLKLMLPRDSAPQELPTRLVRKARKIRKGFSALRPERHWLLHQSEGLELDIDAYILHLVEQQSGYADIPAFYKEYRERFRSLSSLILADLSMSTDAWINNGSRIIDVIQDSLLLFSEALNQTEDRFAVYGFSSRNRQHVRFYKLKSFKEQYNSEARGRILATQPGYYTRMGAAIRYATQLLEKEPTQKRLLLLLTDGKPNDIDLYEGRYGVEDTRIALLEARAKGVMPFCITVDTKAESYLPYLAGKNNWMLVRKLEDLPKKLPLIYGQLARNIN